jgi:hypothetical protein
MVLTVHVRLMSQSDFRQDHEHSPARRYSTMVENRLRRRIGPDDADAVGQ